MSLIKEEVWLSNVLISRKFLTTPIVIAEKSKKEIIRIIKLVFCVIK